MLEYLILCFVQIVFSDEPKNDFLKNLTEMMECAYVIYYFEGKLIFMISLRFVATTAIF